MSEIEKYGYIKLIAGLAAMKREADQSEDKELIGLIDEFVEKIGPEMSENEVAEILAKTICKFMIQHVMLLPTKEGA